MPFVTASPYFKYYYATSAPGPAPLVVGTMFIGGVGQYGQRGTNSITGWLANYSPTQVGAISGWKNIAALGYSIYGINSNNLLYAWGNNFYGELGTNDRVSRSSPVQIGNLEWNSIIGIGQRALAITNTGALYAWGYNYGGEAGDNTTIHRSSPVQIGADSWTIAAASRTQSYGIKSDKTLWAWGSNNFYGSLGLGDTIDRSSPVQVGTDTWNKVSSAGYNVGALSNTNSMYTWGENTYGQLGLGDTVHRSNPVQVGNLSWSDVSADAYKTMGISSGKVYVAGRYPTNENIYSWKMVATGPNFTLGIRHDGTLWGWGANYAGQLGIPDKVFRTSPTQIGTSSWSMVAAGNSFGAAIRSDGRLFTWGDNFYSQLGTGDGISRSSPVQLGTSSWAFVASGASASFGIRSGGSLFAWGGQQFGILGIPALRDFASALSPTQLGTSSWTFVSVGFSNTAAIRSGGGLFVWGGNGSGQLGINVGTGALGRSSPVQVGSLTWSKVSVGDGQIAAIRSDGKLFTWGDNSYGELGISQAPTASRSSPVQVGTNNWTAVAAGEQATFGVSNNNLYAWGYFQNTDDNIRFLGNTSSPVQIGTDVTDVYTRSTNLTNIYSYRYHYKTTSGVVIENRTVAYGHYPIGLSYIDRSSPVQIGSQSNWKQVIATGYGAYLVSTSNQLYRWGITPDILLGDITPAMSPTLINIPNATVISGMNFPSTLGFNSSNPVYGYIQKS